MVRRTEPCPRVRALVRSERPAKQPECSVNVRIQVFCHGTRPSSSPRGQLSRGRPTSALHKIVRLRQHEKERALTELEIVVDLEYGTGDVGVLLDYG